MPFILIRNKWFHWISAKCNWAPLFHENLKTQLPSHISVSVNSSLEQHCLWDFIWPMNGKSKLHSHRGLSFSYHLSLYCLANRCLQWCYVQEVKRKRWLLFQGFRLVAATKRKKTTQETKELFSILNSDILIHGKLIYWFRAWQENMKEVVDIGHGRGKQLTLLSQGTETKEGSWSKINPFKACLQW